jgi:hypothetical protein
MEELTEPLRKALQKGEPVRLRDPETEQIYVLASAQSCHKSVDRRTS